MEAEQAFCRVGGFLPIRSCWFSKARSKLLTQSAVSARKESLTSKDFFLNGRFQSFYIMFWFQGRSRDMHKQRWHLAPLCAEDCRQTFVTLAPVGLQIYSQNSCSIPEDWYQSETSHDSEANSPGQGIQPSPLLRARVKIGHSTSILQVQPIGMNLWSLRWVEN